MASTLDHLKKMPFSNSTTSRLFKGRDNVASNPLSF
ncbi:uncharacterized protein G2W53_042808 [Senna tora]|uniref:Uncharacterized protein n=1 Tax=Senna tora TaxID=362788 RepID=A0A834SHK5_9FABA|nr:uncharacterized protein G2W53_042808 [Senna tora]